MKCEGIGTCYRCGRKGQPLELVRKRRVCQRCGATMRRIEADKRQLQLFSAPQWRPR